MIFWPKIEDLSTARTATRWGFWASIILVGFMIAALIPMQSKAFTHLYGFIRIGVYGIVAWRIFRESRAAAIFGLAFYIYNSLVKWIFGGEANMFIGIDLLLDLFFILAFINSIRGTFGYHELAGPVENKAAVPH